MWVELSHRPGTFERIKGIKDKAHSTDMQFSLWSVSPSLSLCVSWLPWWELLCSTMPFYPFKKRKETKTRF
jgi:hypothetical protein